MPLTGHPDVGPRGSVGAMSEGPVEEAISTVTELLLGDDSIPVQLRMHEGLDQARFERLVAAIEYLIEAYRDEDGVPKVLAHAFVDISNHFFYPEGTYPEDELERIEDAGMRLTQLADRLFAAR